MLFKGTTSRSAQDIAQTIDSIGGQLDAFTAKEYAGYYIKVLDEHLPLAIDLLADMVLRPAFAPADVEREQSVILEEIKMVEDAPDDLVHEVFTAQFWARHPLGRPILGTPETVSSFTSPQLRRYFDDTYVAPQPGRRGGRSPRARGAAALVERAFADASDRRRSGRRCGAPTVARARRSPEGHRAEPCVPRHAGVSAGARRSARAVRAQHDSRRLDELAAVPAHP